MPCSHRSLIRILSKAARAHHTYTVTPDFTSAHPPQSVLTTPTPLHLTLLQHIRHSLCSPHLHRYFITSATACAHHTYTVTSSHPPQSVLTTPTPLLHHILHSLCLPHLHRYFITSATVCAHHTYTVTSSHPPQSVLTTPTPLHLTCVA